MRENKSYYALLGLLSTGPHSGYDIKKKIEQNLSHFWHESYGQIYPNLKKLVEEGYAQVETEQQSGKPDRNVYRITPEGRKLLKDWLTKTIDRLPPEKNELLLKLYFGENLPIADNLKHINDYRNKMFAIRDTFMQIDRMIAASDARRAQPDYPLMTLKFGQKVVQAIIEWCDESAALLERIRSEQQDKKGNG